MAKNIRELVNLNEFLDDRDSGMPTYMIAKKHHIGFQRAKDFLDEFKEKEEQLNSVYGKHKWRFIPREELIRILVRQNEEYQKKEKIAQS